jgi:hypothetical protein
LDVFALKLVDLAPPASTQQCVNYRATLSSTRTLDERPYALVGCHSRGLTKPSLVQDLIVLALQVSSKKTQARNKRIRNIRNLRASGYAARAISSGKCQPSIETLFRG